MRPLILASKSPRRRILLKKLGIPFRVIASHVPEDSQQREPHRLVQELALRKAVFVANKLKKGIVVGADTLVVGAGRIFGQPRDAKDAYKMLYRLSGTTHRVFTGVAIVDVDHAKRKVAYAVSKVRMKRLNLDELLKLSRRNLDKAGAYAIQEKGDPIARVVSGAYDNVVGLPVALVRRLLRGFRLDDIAAPKR